MTPPRVPKLPKLLDRKLYKTGQTRGADDDEIYQNRVSRNSTVLIPYDVWMTHFTVDECRDRFHKGYIVLISPNTFFTGLDSDEALAAVGLTLAENALVFYETRTQWTTYGPDSRGWVPASSRIAPLGGHYVARVAGTTAAAEAAPRIARGFTTTANKGAGIRVYEYADDKAIKSCRLQLEALYWLCGDAVTVAVAQGMTPADAEIRRRLTLATCDALELLDYSRLRQARILNGEGHTVCPLCLEELSGAGFFSRMAQAAGRTVLDLTITQISLFHIQEVKVGMYNHCPYNLGWGHHHCNVVVKDAGIDSTIEWMRTVLIRNDAVAPMCPQRIADK